MIESIQLSNYKAFENVTIPIKPVTILLGANSVGKSSIIQMLMLMHQTAENKGGDYSAALKIYGNFVNAGACANLFTNKVTKDPLSLSIDITSDSIIDFFRKLKSEFIEEFAQLSLFSGSIQIDKYRELTTHLNNLKDFDEYITELVKKTENTPDDISFVLLKHLMGVRFGNNAPQKIKEDFLNTYKFLDRISKIATKCITIKYDLIENNNALKISHFEICSDKPIICIKGDCVSSALVNLSENNKSYVLKHFNSGSTIFDCFSNNEKTQNKTSLHSILEKVIAQVLLELKRSCSESQMNYVSPLRAHPKRYYMLDKANTTVSLNTLDGDEIAEVLKENTSVKNNVNAWFDKFGLKIDVSKFKEVVHNLIVTQNKLKLDITDVGFGISQVLPIIIQGFLSPKESITIIEQPEIHLHPKMQADLGDLFIDIIKDKNKKLIVETHSEYLLRRIRRRISEGKISADDVSICLFHPRTDDSSAVVEILDIGEKGNFHWPEDFYDGELYNDTIEFLKNQN